MSGPQRIARIVIAGVIIGGCGVGLAAPAYANPCDAMAISMTPHQGTACQDSPGPLDGTAGAQPAELAPPQAVASDGAMAADPALSPAAGDPDLPPTG